MGMAKFKQALLEMPVRPLSRHTEKAIKYTSPVQARGLGW